MTQASLWQQESNSASYAELCSALYERELKQITVMEFPSALAVQARLKSLPYYINRAAYLMTQVQSPLSLDVQNASWSSQQSQKMPLSGQQIETVATWYLSIKPMLGLVIPVIVDNQLMLDCIDKVAQDNDRFRTNKSGWFELSDVGKLAAKPARLLKPNKKVLAAACAGHRWRDKQKLRPMILSLRELLLSCAINWQNFKKPRDIIPR